MRRRRKKNTGYGGFAAYVPVSKRKAKIMKMAERLSAKGIPTSPIESTTKRKFVSSFWGLAWCQHLESFADYESRLPRGRTYLRTGSILDLQIYPGFVEAKVLGSELYTQELSIAALSPTKWALIKAAASGQIDSIIDLINGELSKGVLSAIIDRRNGLFPLPSDISMKCNCPDDARLCKHLCAVLYGIGVRMDTDPSVLFNLRGVDQRELISNISWKSEINDSSLSEIFGVDIEVPAD